ncbi:MAG: hypothetical protein MUC42_11275, partial [Bryobacter sp.]|nr:hypothetical protein [Bryobacter sp.]
HDRFAISGGIPNVLLSFGSEQEVRDFTTRVMREVAAPGGYILDAGAIMQDDTRSENLRVMTEVGRELGAYDAPAYNPALVPPADLPSSVESRRQVEGMAGRPTPNPRPGVCYPWEDKVKDLPEITGDKDLVKRVWEDVDAFGNVYIWQLLLSF